MPAVNRLKAGLAGLAVAALALWAPLAPAQEPALTVLDFQDLTREDSFTRPYPDLDVFFSSSDRGQACGGFVDTTRTGAVDLVPWCGSLVGVAFTTPRSYVALDVAVYDQPIERAARQQRPTIRLAAVDGSGKEVAERVVPIAGIGRLTATSIAAPGGAAVIRGVNVTTTAGGISRFDNVAYAFAPYPETAITAGPAAVTTSTDATVAFSTTPPGARTVCSLDGAEPSPCSSPVALADLAEATHSFSVAALDASGASDPTPATISWRVDRTPPQTSIDSGPSDTTDSRDATFTFSSPDGDVARFACSLDGAAFVPCSSPLTLRELTADPHRLSVRAEDQAGLVDPSPALRTWTVDTGVSVADVDADGVLDRDDNCPDDANPQQADEDRDGVGDACELLPSGDLPAVAGRRVVVALEDGEVFVRRPRTRGSARSAQALPAYVPLEGIAAIEVGSSVDARNGRLRLASAGDGRRTRGGAPRLEQEARFAAGIFRIEQRRARARARRARIALGVQLQTPPGRSRACAVPADRRPRRVRAVAMRTTRGLHRIDAAVSTARVSGRANVTAQDRCGGSLTEVGRGRAVVRDRRLRRTVVVRTGRSYLARSRLFGLGRPR